MAITDNRTEACAAGQHDDCDGQLDGQEHGCACFHHDWSHRPTCNFRTHQRACTCYDADSGFD